MELHVLSTRNLSSAITELLGLRKPGLGEVSTHLRQEEGGRCDEETRFVGGDHAPAQTHHEVAPWYNVRSPQAATELAGGSRVFLHKASGISLAKSELQKAWGAVTLHMKFPSVSSTQIFKDSAGIFKDSGTRGGGTVPRAMPRQFSSRVHPGPAMGQAVWQVLSSV